jgi:hypothetical protein
LPVAVESRCFSGGKLKLAFSFLGNLTGLVICHAAGVSDIQTPMVSDATKMPVAMDDQKSKPRRVANANGRKNGTPSGTKMNVSLANFEIGKSRS